jgi:hypothetical protein
MGCVGRVPGRFRGSSLALVNPAPSIANPCHARPRPARRWLGRAPVVDRWRPSSRSKSPSIALNHAVGLPAPPRRIAPRCWLDTDGPVIGDDPTWVVRYFPHVAIGVGEGSAHATPRGACRRQYDLPAGLLGVGKDYPQTTTVSWTR